MKDEAYYASLCERDATTMSLEEYEDLMWYITKDKLFRTRLTTDYEVEHIPIRMCRLSTEKPTKQVGGNGWTIASYGEEQE